MSPLAARKPAFTAGAGDPDGLSTCISRNCPVSPSKTDVSTGVGDPLSTTITSYSSLRTSRWYAAESESKVRGNSRAMS